MVRHLNSKLENLVKVFFGPGNEIKFMDLQKECRFLLEPLYSNDLVSLILPRAKCGEVLWYALSFSNAQLRKQTEELTAFLGPTYTDFLGERARMDDLDPIDCEVMETTRGSVMTFKGTWKVVTERLGIMYKVMSQRPTLTQEAVRPTGRVLRDFYMAVQAGNRELAESDIMYLKDKVRLEAVNLMFLRVQMLAGLHNWKEIIELPSLREILLVRRPASVTAILIQAIYRTQLFTFEETDDSEGAVKHFRDHVLPVFGMLFRVRVGMQMPDVIKAFMIMAVVSQNRELCEELFSSNASSAEDKDYLKKLAGLVSPLQAIDSPENLQSASDALTEGDIDKAYCYAAKVENCIQRAKILLECYYEMQNLEAERLAVDSVQTLSQEERDALLSVRRNRELWFHLIGDPAGWASSDRPPCDWISWLERLNTRGPWNKAQEHSRMLAEETILTDLISREDGMAELVANLSFSRSDETERELYLALPHMLAFFQKDDLWPRAELRDVYENLLMLLAMSTEGGDADLTLFNGLTEALLELGSNKNKYIQLLSDAGDIWKSYASPARLDWILDFADLLFVYPCIDKEFRCDFLISISNRIWEFQRRVKPTQWAVLEVLFFDAGLGDVYLELCSKHRTGVQEDQEQDEVVNILKDKIVAIYTLTERVGVRVKEMLQKICPDVNVQVSNDKVGTDRLKNMARKADYFIVAWQSAKHAATEFINTYRPSDRPVYYAQGKGSASFLRAIYEAVARS